MVDGRRPTRGGGDGAVRRTRLLVVADRAGCEHGADHEHRGDDHGEDPAREPSRQSRGRARARGAPSTCAGYIPGIAAHPDLSRRSRPSRTRSPTRPTPSRMARFRAARPRGRDQARPHPGDRGRPGGRGDDPGPSRPASAPATRVLGEEFGTTRRPRCGGRRWIVDPIDGTKGYARGIPVWATLIALEVDGELVAGVVSAPALGSRWSAARGAGAQRDGERRRGVEGGADRGRPPGLRLGRRVRVGRARGRVPRVGAPVLARARLRRLLGAHARRRRVDRHRGRGRWPRGVGSRRGQGRRRGGRRPVHRPARRATASTPATSSRPTGLVHDDVVAAFAAGDGHDGSRVRVGTEVTVGIDIGTSSVKAIAADGDGNVVARAARPARGAHARARALRARRDGRLARRPAPGAGGARRPRRARRQRRRHGAVARPRSTRSGTPLAPGLLYGDERGRTGVGRRRAPTTRRVGSSATCAGCATRCPTPTASGPRSRSPTTRSRVRRCSTRPPRRSRTRCSTASAGTPRWPASSASRAEQLPRLVPTGWEGGRRSTATAPRWRRGASTRWPSSSSPGPTSPATCSCCSAPRSSCGSSPTRAPRSRATSTIPHTASGNFLVGGPSNAGGLFRDWATRLLAPASDRAARSGCGPGVGALSAWRTGAAQRPRRDARSLHDLDLTHDAAAVVRAADEASAFVVKRAIDAAVAHAGVRAAARRRVGWRARASTRGCRRSPTSPTLPVDCVAVPEGGALGSAWLARIAAGLEEPTAMTEGRRWARVGRRIEPRDRVDARRPPTATSVSSRSADRREHHDLAGEHEVGIARREAVAVELAQRDPYGRDLGVGDLGSRARPSWRRAGARSSSHRLSPGPTTTEGVTTGGAAGSTRRGRGRGRGAGVVRSRERRQPGARPAVANHGHVVGASAADAPVAGASTAPTDDRGRARGIDGAAHRRAVPPSAPRAPRPARGWRRRRGRGGCRRAATTHRAARPSARSGERIRRGRDLATSRRGRRTGSRAPGGPEAPRAPRRRRSPATRARRSRARRAVATGNHR